MSPLEHLPNGAKHTIDAAAVAGLAGSLFSVLPAATVILTFIWVMFRMLDTRMAKALLFRLFGFDLEAWMSVNRAGKPVDDDG